MVEKVSTGEPLTQRDLQQFLDTLGVAATILPLDEPTETVADAARALGVGTDRIIKSLVFTVAEIPLLVSVVRLGSCIWFLCHWY